MKITGEFEVNLKPLDTATLVKDGINFRRLSINKSFTGALVGTSKGEMLSTLTSVNDSAGYVAVEQVSGKLAGRSGSFVLQHYGTMNQGQEFLLLEVIPDSATGGLVGLTGTMKINIADGKHFYEFECQFV